MADADIASIAVKIDQKTITETVERIVLQEIASKLGDPGAYFERVVRSCVGTKVDAAGNPSNSSYNTSTLIEHTATKAINEFAKTVVNKWLADNSDKLETSIKKALEKNIGTMAKVMADAAVKGAGWGTVGVTITPRPRD